MLSIFLLQLLIFHNSSFLVLWDGWEKYPFLLLGYLFIAIGFSIFKMDLRSLQISQVCILLVSIKPKDKGFCIMCHHYGHWPHKRELNYLDGLRNFNIFTWSHLIFLKFCHEFTFSAVALTIHWMHFCDRAHESWQ